MFDPGWACEIAVQCARKPDDTWNKRFVSMLRILGYELEPYKGQVMEGDELFAPKPVEIGWQYPYPSVIVTARKFLENRGGEE